MDRNPLDYPAAYPIAHLPVLNHVPAPGHVFRADPDRVHGFVEMQPAYRVHAALVAEAVAAAHAAVDADGIARVHYDGQHRFDANEAVTLQLACDAALRHPAAGDDCQRIFARAFTFVVLELARWCEAANRLRHVDDYVGPWRGEQWYVGKPGVVRYDRAVVAPTGVIAYDFVKNGVRHVAVVSRAEAISIVTATPTSRIGRSLAAALAA